MAAPGCDAAKRTHLTLSTPSGFGGARLPARAAGRCLLLGTEADLSLPAFLVCAASPPLTPVPIADKDISLSVEESK